MSKVILILIMLVPSSFVIYNVIEEIIEFIKERRKLSDQEKATLDLIMAMIILPCAIYYMDRYNLFSKLGLNKDISPNYDWLSFIGTCGSVWISTYMLFYVTRKDRKESNENVRESQRPCLCVSTHSPEDIRKYGDASSGYISNEDNISFNRFIIDISNSGQTVAIINTKKSYFIIKKYIEEMIVSDKNVNEIVQKLVAEKIFFNEYEDRLHICSNSKARITLTDQGLYMINCESMEKPNVDEVYIEYKDLFGKKYKDYVRFTDEKAIVIYDNEVIEGD